MQASTDVGGQENTVKVSKNDSDQDDEEESNVAAKVKESTNIEKAIKRNDGDPIPVTKKEIDINIAHNQWGYHGERRLKEMASVYGFRLTGTLSPCDACGIAKASQSRISKTTEIKATKPGERLYMDTTGPFSKASLKDKYLHGAVDDYSGKMFAQFSNTKKNMAKFAEEVISKCDGNDKKVKYIRIDGGGENEDIVKLAESKGGITIEKTPPFTSQYNGRIERRFPVIISMAMAMVWAAGFVKDLKMKLFSLAIETAIFLHDIAPTARSKKSAYELWHGEPPKWKPSDLKEFGRIGIVKIKDKYVKKCEEKGAPMIMVGYAQNAPVGTYRMYNPKTKRVITTDSVTWSKFTRWQIKGELKGIFEDAVELAKDPGLPNYDEGGIMIGESEPVEIRSETRAKIVDKASDEVNKSTTVVGGHRMTLRSHKRSPVEVNVTSTKAPKRDIMTDGKKKVTGNTKVKRITLEDGISVIEEEQKGKLRGIVNSALFIFNTSLNSDPGEPKNDDEALNGPERDWWLPSSIAEVNNFLDRGSWKFVPREAVKKLGRKLIKTKTIYKKKDEADGTVRYKTRIVSKGYMQIPGVDFTEKFSPAATDTSIRIVIALILFFWDSHG